jgi:flagellar biosynthesis protein FliP
VISLLGVTAALTLVLVLLGLAMRGLQKLSGGLSGGRQRVPLEVLQRVAVGPKQGVALVRIGSQVIAVSVGEGGVRPILEVSGEERALLLEPAEPVIPLRLPPAANHFRDVLVKAARTATRSAALLVPLALLLGATVPAEALAQPAAAPVAQAATATAVEQFDAGAARLAPQIDLRVGDQRDGGLRLSGTVGVVIMMGLLTLLPTLVLMMTSFTRILIVLHFLRQALGTQSAPPAHLLAALALLLTGFVMAPTLSQVNESALQPWLEGRMEQGEMLVTASQPFREFMLAETRPSDVNTFLQMSATPRVANADEIPLVVLVSAFVISELRTAFQIGFALFLPFIVIDIVVASVLMSMGMFMLPPAMIALPFKLLLFVLVDGWSLIVQGLVASFR